MSPGDKRTSATAKSVHEKDVTTEGRNKAFLQLLLRQAQVISTTICLYGLIKSGVSEQTILAAAVAALAILLSLTFKLRNR